MSTSVLDRAAVINYDPDCDGLEEWMIFRLTYEGPLLGASKDTPRAKHKHEIRRCFHPQLRQLWQVTHLKDLQEFSGVFPQGMLGPPEFGSLPPSRNVRLPSLGKRKDLMADRYKRNGYRFIPLVTEDLSVACGIDVLYLRPEPPGEIIKCGDIDNRLKTLFDALRMPKHSQELGGYDTPQADEDPFYCLLEDDKLISKVTVDTDILLQPTSSVAGQNDARLIITVNLRPYKITWTNLVLG